MQTQIITEVHREHGVIASLYGEGWGPRSKARVVDDIQRGRRDYRVLFGPLIRVVHGPRSEYLRSFPDGIEGNNLERLPEHRGSETEVRAVTEVERDHGAIALLYGEGWGPRTKDDVMADIENGRCHYRVARGRRIGVVHGPAGDYLRSLPSSSLFDNLGELPEH